MKHFVTRSCIFLLVFFLSMRGLPQANSPSASLLLTVDIQGNLLINANYKLTSIFPSPKALAGQNYGISFAILPFRHNRNWNVTSAPDIRISPLSSGPGYTVLTILHPLKQQEVRFRISKGITLDETPEGKSKLEFDLSYPFMSQAEREVMSLPTTISFWDISVVLPKNYSDYEISMHPKALQRKDAQRYCLTASVAKTAKVDKVWIVFPDPRKERLGIAKLIFALLFGLFTAFLQISPLRERKISLLFTIFLLSSVILFIALYFFFTLAKGIDFAIWAGASIPHVLFSGFFCLYLLLANKYQAMIGGSITLDGEPTDFAEIKLLGFKDNEEITVARTEKLQNGQYVFHVWIRRAHEYQVAAGSKLAPEGRSDRFTVSSRDKYPVPAINLERIHITRESKSIKDVLGTG